MARKSSTRALGIWINGKHAASWNPANSRGKSELLYADMWVKSAEGRPLSLSLPLNIDNEPLKSGSVDNYFENLLPESDVIRQRIRERYQTASKSPFDLLAAVGRDCVGAVQLLPAQEVPSDVQTINARPLQSRDVERLLLGTTSPSQLASVGQEELRISIAGAQEKTALLRHNGEWCLPLGSTPTTHILKLPLGLVGGVRADMSLSVENEWLCSKILAAFDIPVAHCEVETFGDVRTLVVERFDRQLHSSGAYWLRLMQEDFCQVNGLPSTQKYEADGGPGILEICKTLRASSKRDEDLRNFLKAQIVFWLLAAGDGHAKNFSVRILPEGRYQLTPLYDVLSYYPIIGDTANRISSHNVRMAMAFRGKNKHYAWRSIQWRHIAETVDKSGYGESANALIESTLADVPGVIEQVTAGLPQDFPEPLAESILDGLATSAVKLERTRH